MENIDQQVKRWRTKWLIYIIKELGISELANKANDIAYDIAIQTPPTMTLFRESQAA